MAAGTPPRDGTELRVVRTFEDLLGKAPIGVDENFFDRGGHSMLAVQLIAKINSMFRVNLGVSVLFEEPAAEGDAARPVPGSAERLASVVRQHTADEWQDCLVALGRRGSGPPLFCVHPAGGDVAGFRDLALTVAAERPLYALQAPPLDHPEAAQRIEDLAARYAEAIRTEQAHGPYLLLGWAVGGLVAFEMARLLRNAGAQVGILTLVDAHLADQVPDRDETGLLLDFARQLGHLRGTELPVSEDDLQRRCVAEGIDYVRAQAVAAGVLSPDLEREALLGRLRLYRAHLRAARAYRPTRHDAPVLLIQAGEQDAARRETVTREWAALCGESLRVRTLGGDPFSIMRQPRVNELARILAETAGL